VTTLSDLFNIYRLPVGRRVFALRKTRGLIETDPDQLLLVNAAMAHDTNVLELRAGWLVTKDIAAKYPPRVIELDIEHDRLLASIHRVADGIASGMSEQTPAGAAARRILQNVYAAGVAALIQLEFVQQRESTNTWLARLNGELRDDVVLVGVAPMVDRLAQVNAEFGNLLDGFQPPAKVTFEQLRTQDLLGQELMLRVVASIAGRYNGHKAGDDDKRTALLSPILAQNQEVAETYRRKTRVSDVDPSTGVVVADPVPNA
jgi:hypothetical protein